MSVLEHSKVNNEAGVYKHPETGVEVVARPHPKFGNAQADGFVNAGFVYVGPAPAKEEVKEEPKQEKGTKK